MARTTPRRTSGNASTYVRLDESWGDDGWYRFPNAFIRDKRLTWNARAIASWMASHDPSFAISVGTIIAAGPLGRDGVYAALRCLKDHGYLHEHQERNADGTLGSVIYQLFPRPRAEQPRTENPEAAPTSENGTSSQVAPLTGQPYTAQPTHKKTKGSKKIKKTTSSPPSSPLAAAPPSRRQEEEEPEPERSEEPAPAPSGAALEIVDAASWPLGQRPNDVQRDQVAEPVGRCLAAGHTPAAIAQVLNGALPGTHSPVGSAITALCNLAGKAPRVERPMSTPRRTTALRELDDRAARAVPAANSSAAAELAALRQQLGRRRRAASQSTAYSQGA